MEYVYTQAFVFTHNTSFSQHSSQSGQVKVDSNKFQNKIDNSHLWNDASDHNHWITRLVISLLGSGGVTDEVLLLVTSVCEVKVNN